ncbi:hypothetical protein MTO96_026335 [Rhipicephalus appendiculatus]
MTLVNFLVATTFLAVSVFGFAYNTDTGDSVSCDFTGLDLDTSISRFLAKIPVNEDRLGPSDKGTFAGIEFLGINVTGMNKLSRYGPVIPYCINGTRMVQVELVNKGDVTISFPWKSCAGLRGTIDFKAYITRFTTQLRVKEHGLGDVRFSHEGPLYPVSTENINLRVRGAGTFAMLASDYLSLIFPAALRALWNDQFFYFANIAIDKAVD